MSTVEQQNQGAFGAIADHPDGSPQFHANARLARERVLDLIALGEPASKALYRVIEATNLELSKLRPPRATAGPETEKTS